jgi:LCP family protein required for cell wall assembly
VDSVPQWEYPSAVPPVHGDGSIGDSIGDGTNGGYGGGGRSHLPRRGWFRRTLRRLLGLVLLIALVCGGGYLWADRTMAHGVDLASVPDRPAAGRGTNYLIVGSDSRAGMSAAQRKDLHTGGSAGAGERTDSVILLHTGAHGVSMTSLPRDSWVTIPSYVLPTDGIRHPARKDKLNAAFSEGGPQLLLRTIEGATGVRIDHYTEIGFGGFVGIVDAVGGVPMCLDKAVDDPKSGEHLAKGCHTLNGHQALAFVRQRHQEANGDLGRTRNQQKFLAALAKRAETPGVAADPARMWALANAGLGTLTVDSGTHPADLLTLFQAMRGGGAGATHLNVPTGKAIRTYAGDALPWDESRARTLFAEIREDRPVTVKG